MNETRNKSKEGKERNRTQRVARSVTGVIAGTFLKRENVVKQLPFLVFIVVLALIYISNSYGSEKLIVGIERIKKENEILRYEHILMKSKLMYYSRQSEVAKKLNGTGLRESTIPPHKVVAKN